MVDENHLQLYLICIQVEYFWVGHYDQQFMVQILTPVSLQHKKFTWGNTLFFAVGEQFNHADLLLRLIRTDIRCLVL